MYELADRLIKRANRRNLRLFDKLRLLAFDELNVMRTASEVYEQMLLQTKRDYLRIAIQAYIDALLLAEVREDSAKRRASRNIDEDWILDMLEEYDAVTLYRFIPETDRKKMRTAEAIIASRGSKTEIDKSMRLWTGQITQYSITATDRATLQGYRDAGIKYVRWNTQEDEKVCPYCNGLNGKVFPIDKAPKKQHLRCRCYYTPVRDPARVSIVRERESAE